MQVLQVENITEQRAKKLWTQPQEWVFTELLIVLIHIKYLHVERDISTSDKDFKSIYGNTNWSYILSRAINP